jgi:hypothetical protein
MVGVQALLPLIAIAAGLFLAFSGIRSTGKELVSPRGLR